MDFWGLMGILIGSCIGAGIARAIITNFKNYTNLHVYSIENKIHSLESRIDRFEHRITAIEERLFWLANGKTLKQAVEDNLNKTKTDP